VLAADRRLQLFDGPKRTTHAGPAFLPQIRHADKWSLFEAEVRAALIGVTSCPLEKGLWTKLHGAEQSLHREDDASGSSAIKTV
jgi:hypothetical protein